MKKLIFGLSIVMLAGCNATKTEPQKAAMPTGTILKYQCEKQPLLVTLDNEKERVYFAINGQIQQLDQVISASGAKYSNSQYTFWSKGNSAFVTYNDDIIINDCNLQF